jgi:hypothetical protein
MTALQNDLTSLGMPPALASRMGVVIKSATGVGTAQGGSSPRVFGGDVVLLTTAAGATAATLDTSFPVGESAVVANISATTGLIFPPTSGTINGGSANASVQLPAGSVATITRTSPTAFWVQFGAAAAGSTTVILGGSTDGVTAAAGGGQANATQLTGVMANVTTVASAADSVKLPLAQAGMVFMLNNATGTSMQVFGAGTDTIAGIASATGAAQASGMSVVYFATTSAPAGKWFRVRGA